MIKNKFNDVLLHFKLNKYTACQQGPVKTNEKWEINVRVFLKFVKQNLQHNNMCSFGCPQNIQVIIHHTYHHTSCLHEVVCPQQYSRFPERLLSVLMAVLFLHCNWGFFLCLSQIRLPFSCAVAIMYQPQFPMRESKQKCKYKQKFRH